jgi:hypothetical protein
MGLAGVGGGEPGNRGFWSPGRGCVLKGVNYGVGGGLAPERTVAGWTQDEHEGVWSGGAAYSRDDDSWR